ncbi:hypothetical protein EAF56_20280 [Vibrio alginolyticus]|nr:hypothetical protein [Vibrio alginolyticus]
MKVNLWIESLTTITPSNKYIFKSVTMSQGAMVRINHCMYVQVIIIAYLPTGLLVTPKNLAAMQQRERLFTRSAKSMNILVGLEIP